MYAWGGLRDSARGQTRFALFKSTSRGQTWTTMLEPGRTGLCLGFVLAGSGETLYAYGSQDSTAALYRSTTHGAAWTRSNYGVTGFLMRDFAQSPADSHTFFCATSEGVFRSRNDCANWTNLGLHDVSAILPDTDNVDFAYVGTDTQGLFFTTDAGVFWDRDTIGLQSRTVLLLKRRPQDPAAVYCATAGASLQSRGVIGIADSEFELRTSDFALAVWPSLVSTRAQVALAAGNRRTRVELYRADGRLALEIADLCPTPARLVWARPAGLARGVYLLVARSGSERRVAKLVLAP
jgi:hypothetical protein